MLGNFTCFCCHLLTFFKLNFFPIFFPKNNIRVSDSLDQDKYRHSVGIDLCLNYSQRFQADDKFVDSKERDETIVMTSADDKFCDILFQLGGNIKPYSVQK